jgi:hypothetical protein
MYAARNSIGLHTCAPLFEQSTETTTADNDCDWLRRNDSYKMQQIGGRMRPVNIHSADQITQLSGLELPQLGTIVNQTNTYSAVEHAG